MTTRTLSRVGIIGLGAIGTQVLKALQTTHLPLAAYAVLNHAMASSACASLRPFQSCNNVEELIAWRPDLVIECAGHSAVISTVPVLLAAGIDVIVASIGALADQPLHSHLHNAAQEGNARLILVSGAIGGLDALRSARLAGLDEVLYVGRKPPRAWAGSPAEQAFDLARINLPTTIFRGTAAQASIQFPKNANVTAAVALSGVGFDKTQVELVADPDTERNVHEVQARGPFGELSIHLANNPLPANPRTSWLAALSIEEAVCRQMFSLVF
ncbi:aspartate dehydrogenase [Pseudomonas sp. NA-150]|uniref:aspartate dehydrogenase n=1 Tax=Pseudomonas sp. NA-150 TaxID=3367525 RepID=UPI0037C99ECC